jgi:Uma2 family endonuclease
VSSAPNQRCTTAEYLAFEREAESRHEFVDGQIVEMQGGTARHALICDNLVALAKTQLRNTDCRPYSAALRVKIEATGNYAYPDLSIVCGGERFEDQKQDTLLNPRLIIEVLSPSTERHDRGWKFRNYQLISSFEEYLLVSQDEPRVERFLRQGEVGWLMTQVVGLDQTVRFESIGCELFMRDIYEDVQFIEEAAATL